jgi:hypothetical protein
MDELLKPGSSSRPGFSFWNIHHLTRLLRLPNELSGSRRLILSKPLKIQIVELARALIADEQHWCTHNLALDNNGIGVSPTSSRAVKRCALGALIAAANQLTHDFDAAYKLGHEALARIGHHVILMHVNDVRGHAAVLALFDQVIAEG